MRFYVFALFYILLLSACTPPSVQERRSVQVQNSQATQTQAALFVQTEIARPSRTPTALPTSPPTQTPIPPTVTPAISVTPTPPAQQSTPQPGLAFYTHPDLPEYVFQIDPNLWEKDPSDKTANLILKANSDCRIESVPGQGVGAPERFFWQDLGRFRWEIMDYGTWAFTYPVAGVGLSSSQNSFLRLPGYNRKSCRDQQEEILKNLFTAREASGEMEFALYRSPTPRPALEGFDCPGAPAARLRVGDQVSVITNGLWLRSEPRVDDSTKVRQFLEYPPFLIRVVGGPVCEKYVYWQVEVGEFGEGGGMISGWLAEGDPEEYYLVPVR